MVSGLMFGLMFGIGAIGAAGLGKLADVYGVAWVYRLTSFLPLLGFATALLPNTRGKKQAADLSPVHAQAPSTWLDGHAADVGIPTGLAKHIQSPRSLAD